MRIILKSTLIFALFFGVSTSSAIEHNAVSTQNHEDSTHGGLHDSPDSFSTADGLMSVDHDLQSAEKFGGESLDNDMPVAGSCRGTIPSKPTHPANCQGRTLKCVCDSSGRNCYWSWVTYGCK